MASKRKMPTQPEARTKETKSPILQKDKINVSIEAAFDMTEYDKVAADAEGLRKKGGNVSK